MIGHVYKIIHLDSNIQYIGSTCNTTRDRWSKHKNNYKKWLSNKEKNSGIAIYPYFEQYSIDRFKMILIKSYEIVDKKHLYAMEQLAMNRTKCVNQQAALQLISTTCMARHFNIINSEKERKKIYREANRDKLSERRKLYYEANRDKSKEYYQQNKQSISKYKKEYRETNREKISEQKSVKVTCECGAQVTKGSLSRHKKSDKCIAALAALTN